MNNPMNYLISGLIGLGKPITAKKGKNKGSTFYKCICRNLTNKGHQTFEALLSKEEYLSLENLKDRVAFFQYMEEGYQPAWRDKPYDKHTYQFAGGDDSNDITRVLQARLTQQKLINKVRQADAIDWGE